MSDKLEIIFPTAERAGMALAKLFDADFIDTQVGVSGKSLVCLNGDVLRSAVEILSPPGISIDRQIPHDLAMGAIKEAGFYIAQAIWQLGYAADNLLEAGMPAKHLVAKNAAKQLEAFQSVVLERKLNAQTTI